MLNTPAENQTDGRFLVTGAKGFIGAWVVKVLVERGDRVLILDLDADSHRLRALLSAEQLESVPFIRGDVSRLEDVERAVADHGVTHVIHLAALQVPFCVANPPLGALVNVVGTVNVFETVKHHRDRVRSLVYASSAAVYGTEEFYGADQISDDAPLQPATLYGVFKQCNEGTARIYYANDGVSSIALRPSTVYGAGRDQGLTSGPTKAIKACVARRPYTIRFTGRMDMQYARDTAITFIRAAESGLEGAHIYTPRGAVVNVADFLAALERQFPDGRRLVRAEGKPLPLPADVENKGIRRDFPDLPVTPLDEGIRETAEVFRRLQLENRLDLSDLDV
jgi:nucleoside-diphosphate-sugar epimerase